MTASGAILRCDHLQAVALTLEFIADQLGNLGIEIGEMSTTLIRKLRSFGHLQHPKRARRGHIEEYQIGDN
jgi:hypothetical protein